MKLYIRRIKQDDILPLAHIFVDVYEHFDVGERWTVETAGQLLQYWFDKQSDLAFAAEDNSKLIGAFLVEVKPWWDGNRLVNGELFIDPAYQKQGIGKKLLQTVFEKAITNYHVTEWEFLTFARHEFPLRWYEKMGFKKSDEIVYLSGSVKIALEYLQKK